jgi:hypothetical protein
VLSFDDRHQPHQELVNLSSLANTSEDEQSCSGEAESLLWFAPLLIEKRVVASRMGVRTGAL